jgi:hypothetical protein
MPFLENLVRVGRSHEEFREAEEAAEEAAAEDT